MLISSGLSSQVEQCVARRVTPVTRISAFVNVTHDSVPALKVIPQQI